MAYYIGLISGTSLDGCDAALIRCEGEKTSLVHYLCLPMTQDMRQKVLDACSLDKSSVRLICSLNVEMGHWFAQAARQLIQEAGISADQIACIGSHGQTVYHIPFEEEAFVPSTLQIGEPAVIAWETGIPVVSAMRAMDMAAGGQGAPLVPYSEYLLYRGPEAIALQNLGGIGNVTVLPANCAPEDVFAFDTGPANMIMDALSKHFFDQDYDQGGKLAAQGQVNEALLSQWMAIPYVDAKPPKSTGRELYGQQFVDLQIAAHPQISGYDFIATAAMYTAATMQRNYELYVFPRCQVKRIVLGGGGAHNDTLRRFIQQRFPQQQVLTQEDLGWSSDAKEAVAFALIARETMAQRPGNLPSATGASRLVPLGAITYPPR